MSTEIESLRAESRQSQAVTLAGLLTGSFIANVYQHSDIVIVSPGTKFVLVKFNDDSVRVSFPDQWGDDGYRDELHLRTPYTLGAIATLVVGLVKAVTP